MTLLEQLKYIRDNGVRNEEAGICDALSATVMDEFQDLYFHWPKHSGRAVYPVPCPNGGSAGCAYLDAKPKTMWDRDHPYGALRHELLNWCIAQLEK